MNQVKVSFQIGVGEEVVSKDFDSKNYPCVRDMIEDVNAYMNREWPEDLSKEKLPAAAAEPSNQSQRKALAAEGK